VRDVLKNLDKLPDPAQKIVVYCGSGQRGGMLTGVLRMLGYSNVFNVSGGLGAWKKANLPVETGSMPDAPKAISTPTIADAALYKMLDESMSTLPDGFLALKADKFKEHWIAQLLRLSSTCATPTKSLRVVTSKARRTFRWASSSPALISFPTRQLR